MKRRSLLIMSILIFNLLCVSCENKDQTGIPVHTTLPTLTPEETRIPTQTEKLNHAKDFYTKVKGVDGTYSVILYDKNKKTMKKLDYPKEPYVGIIEKRYIEVKISVGSPANYTFFYDTETEKISPDYFNYIHCEKGIVVYMSNGKLVFSDMFDKDVFFLEIERDFSPSATGLVVSKVTFLEDNKASITYFEGNEWKEKTEVITIK